MAFAIEEIPDEDKLFRRIHHTHLLPEGEISSAAFKQPRMSVNWEKYRDAKSTADENSAADFGNHHGEVKHRFNQSLPRRF